MKNSIYTNPHSRRQTAHPRSPYPADPTQVLSRRKLRSASLCLALGQTTAWYVRTGLAVLSTVISSIVWLLGCTSAFEAGDGLGVFFRFTVHCCCFVLVAGVEAPH